MSGLRNRMRGLLDPKPGKLRTHPVRNGAILLTLATFALVSGVTHHLPLVGTSGRLVRAEFAAADQVNDRTPVRIGGVKVGQVEKVEPGRSPGRTSVVLMRITNGGLVVRRDAGAQIRWRTLLGGSMYIDLQPGSPSAPPLAHGVIPASRTSNQVEFDQLLEVYEGGTAQAQRDMLRGVRRGLGDPRATGTALRTMSPTLRTVARGIEPLRGQNSDDLRRLVAATAKTVDGLGRDTAALQGLVDGGDRTLAVIDAQRRDLGDLIELSPPSLDSTYTTMRRLRTTLDHLDPLVTHLRPGAVALAPAASAATPTLEQTDAVLQEVRPLLLSAGPTFDSLRGASRAGVPLLRGLDPTLRRLDAELLPYLRRRDSGTRLRNYESLGPTFSVLDDVGAEYDSLGHRSRFTVPFGATSVSTAYQDNLTRGCERTAGPSGRVNCAPLAQVISRAWFGGPKR